MKSVQILSIIVTILLFVKVDTKLHSGKKNEKIVEQIKKINNSIFDLILDK